MKNSPRYGKVPTYERKIITFKPNFLFYWMMNKIIQNRNELDPTTATDEFPQGQKSIIKIFNFGGSRSSKTFDAIHLIVQYCDQHKRRKKLKIDVYRSELIDAKDILLEDFKACFDIIGLEEGNEYKLTGDSQSGRPEISLWGSKIYFKGYPDKDKEAGFCDIAYINEVLERSDRKDVYDSIKKRCSTLIICDGNPKFTNHWAFEQYNDFNTFYSQTTYLDNQHLPPTLAAERESKCPWDFKDSHIEIVEALPDMPIGQNEHFHNGFRRRVWDKPERPAHITEDPEKIYRADHPTNIERKTADKFDYLVYSEGVRAIRQGAVFDVVTWIDEFPIAGYDEVVLGMDFGYTRDNTTLNRIGRVGNNDAYIENMVCQPTETPEICFWAIYDALEQEEKRRQNEGIENYNQLYIVCESQDRHATSQFVVNLNQLALAHGKNWNFFKVSKKTILAGVTIMKKFNLFLVDNPRFRIEQQNYVYREVKGEATNEPDPDSKFCDIWDGARYAFQHYFSYIIHVK